MFSHTIISMDQKLTGTRYNSDCRVGLGARHFWLIPDSLCRASCFIATAEAMSRFLIESLHADVEGIC
jgi:hypothetical protein